MAEWEVKNVIDYSPNGDDIDTFSQKVKAEEETIYERMNRVRKNDAGAGVVINDAVPYQFKIDTATEPATIYILDGQSNNWVKMGKVAPAWGLDAEEFGGIANAGGISTMALGRGAEKPENAKLRALYFAYDEKKIYIFTGTAWEIFLSLDYDDIVDKEESAVSWDDVATSGANKIIKTNADGEIETNITGQAARMAGKKIVVRSLDEKEALVFDGTNWTNQKVALVDSNGLVNASITGNAAKIAGVTIKTDANLSDGQVLVYRAATNTFENENKGGIGAAAQLAVTSNGERIVGYDGSEAKTLPMEAAVYAGEELPEQNPLHFVEIQA